MTKRILAAIAEVAPDDGHNHISRLDVRRGGILNIRVHAAKTAGEGLRVKLRQAIENAVGDQRHSIEIVWNTPSQIDLGLSDERTGDLRP